MRHRAGSSVVLIVAAFSLAGVSWGEETRQFNIPPQPLDGALLAFAEQAGAQVSVSAGRIESRQSPGVTGERPPPTALEELLSKTNLKPTPLSAQTYWVTEHGSSQLSDTAIPRRGDWAPADVASQVAPGTTRKKDTSRLLEVESGGIPEVLVTGSRVLNMDIRRTEDDAQPYVVFDRHAIRQSGATSVEDFLKNHLTMNTQSVTVGAVGGTQGNVSLVNLRGLGTNQTLILVDGHRLAATLSNGFPGQPDLNAIPVAAIERIEVLPTTASGIYGGSATGGVINIVLRRDYSGIALGLSYGDTFASDGESRGLDLSGGFNLEDGRTSILFAGSYRDESRLSTDDRDFVAEGLQQVFRNNPGAVTGASNPPLGRTTNIRSVNASPLFGPGSPSFTHVPVGYAGGGGLTPLSENAGQYNLEPARSAQLTGTNRSLVMGTTLESLLITARREFGSRTHAYLEGAASRKVGEFRDSLIFSNSYTIAANAPNNPFGQAIRVTVPLDACDTIIQTETQDERIVGGFVVQLSSDWTAGADYTWSRYRGEFSLSGPSALSGGEAALIGNGSLDVLRDTNVAPLNFGAFLLPGLLETPATSTSRDAVLRLAGPVAKLPAGDIVLSTLVERRYEYFGEGFAFVPNATILFPDKNQEIDSAYLEARIPIFSPSNRVAGAEEVEVQLAGRHDKYTVEGVTTSVTVGGAAPIVRSTRKTESTNPTFAIRYKPMDDFAVRASYGTGFLPPSVLQIAPTPSSTSASFLDPRRGGALTVLPPGQLLTGGNPDLEPEESTSWSVGVLVTPDYVPGLRVSADYTSIEKTNNISNVPGSTQGLVDNESLFPGRVVRGSNLPSDQPGWAGPIAFVDRTLVNIARAEVEAYDVSMDYRLDSSEVGTFDFHALATWQTQFRTQLLPVSPVIENVGVGSQSPLRFKANAGLAWSFNPWRIGWTARYFDSYLVSRNATLILNQGDGGRVSSQIYHDFFATYRLDPGTSSNLIDGVELQLVLKNVFRTKPPFNAADPTRFYSPYGDPRLGTWSLTVRKDF